MGQPELGGPLAVPWERTDQQRSALNDARICALHKNRESALIELTRCWALRMETMKFLGLGMDFMIDLQHEYVAAFLRDWSPDDE